MKKLSLILAAALILGAVIYFAEAADTGASFPTAFASDNEGSGTAGAWNNPENAGANDNSYTRWNNSGSQSAFLKVNDFDFNIPSDATIDGIEVRLAGMDSGNASVFYLFLMKDGDTRLSEDKGDGADWAAAEEVKVYGDNTDLWSETWTAAEINATGFGVAYGAGKASFSAHDIDYITITVYYTEAPENPAASATVRTGSVQVRTGSIEIR